MLKQKQTWKRILAIACILLILAYTSVVFLPHSHECVDLDCAICTLIEISRNALIGLGIFGAASWLKNSEFILTNKYSYIISIGEATPVRLKVKLSD